MACAYCGNPWQDDIARCDSCGSRRRVRTEPQYRDADALYAEVGHALITSEPDRSRALLEKILGSPEKEPKTLWTERAAKVAVCLFLLWMFPWVFFALAAMALPFIIMIYLPYKGFSALFSWISGGDARQ